MRLAIAHALLVMSPLHRSGLDGRTAQLIDHLFINGVAPSNFARCVEVFQAKFYDERRLAWAQKRLWDREHRPESAPSAPDDFPEFASPDAAVPYRPTEHLMQAIFLKRVVEQRLAKDQVVALINLIIAKLDETYQVRGA